MYEYRQYKKRIQRIIIFLCSIILLYIIVHLIQTGIFLSEHFFQNEDTNDMIKLDMNIWKKNEKFNRKIPRYIHQIWISSINNKSMFKRFEKASDSCIIHHLNYNYTLWTHKNLLNFLKIEYPWFLSIYQTYDYDMQRIDAMKYFLLYHFGGIYIDLDIKCDVKDLLNIIIPKNQTIYEPDIMLHMGTEGISANTDFMAAKRYHPFFKLAINRLKSANRWFYLYHLTIILSAGPTFLYGIYRTYPLKENFYFIPNNLLFGNSIGGVGGATWIGKDTLILVFFMENKVFAGFFFIFIMVILFYVFRLLLKRKRFLD